MAFWLCHYIVIKKSIVVWCNAKFRRESVGIVATFLIVVIIKLKKSLTTMTKPKCSARCMRPASKNPKYVSKDSSKKYRSAHGKQLGVTDKEFTIFNASLVTNISPSGANYHLVARNLYHVGSWCLTTVRSHKLCQILQQLADTDRYIYKYFFSTDHVKYPPISIVHNYSNMSWCLIQ